MALIKSCLSSSMSLTSMSFDATVAANTAWTVSNKNGEYALLIFTSGAAGTIPDPTGNGFNIIDKESFTLITDTATYLGAVLVEFTSDNASLSSTLRFTPAIIS